MRYVVVPDLQLPLEVFDADAVAIRLIWTKQVDTPRKVWKSISGYQAGHGRMIGAAL
jgi:hypothetical protein